MATWPSGKAGVCKTPIAGSNPAVASLLGFILIVKANHFLWLAFLFLAFLFTVSTTSVRLVAVESPTLYESPSIHLAKYALLHRHK